MINDTVEIATQIVQADFGISGFIIYTIISIALSYAASILLAPGPPDINPLEDNADSTAGTRGTLAPLLLGYNKVKPIIAFVGNRYVWWKTIGTVPDPDGFWEEDDDIKQQVYREQGMHILCVGPARSLYQILEGGKIIFDQDIRPATHPSGTELLCTDPDTSAFKIYWGEPDQPVDTGTLNNGLDRLTGVSSRYPYCCYIHWTRKELGPNPKWKALEYIMDCSTLGEEAQFIDEADASGGSFNGVWESTWGGYYMSTTTDITEIVSVGDTLELPSAGVSFIVSSIRLNGSTYYIYPAAPVSLTPNATYACTSFTAGSGRRGVNPMLAIRQLLFYGFPHGLASDTSLYDMDSLNDLIPYFASGGTETSPATVYLKTGISYQGALSMLFQDYGLNMYPDAITGKYTFALIRSGETSTVLEDDYIDWSSSEDAKGYSVLAPEKTVYTFVEAERNFTTSTIIVDDDGKASLSGNPNAKKISIKTVTDIPTASMVASRREQEMSMDRAVKLRVSSLKESYNIGDLVTFESVAGVWRVASKQTDSDVSYINITFVLDTYSIDNNYIPATTSGLQVGQGAFPDTYVIAFGGNRYLDPDVNGYYIIRQRYHTAITQAWLYRSETDVTADFRSGSSVLGNNAIGLITEDVGADGGVLDSLEITIDTSEGSDFRTLTDIDISDADWRSGMVLIYIGGELMSLGSTTIIDEFTATLDDLLRGRFGTAPAVHLIDDEIGIFYKTSRTFIKDTVIADGDTVYLRTRPSTPTELMDLDGVASVVLGYNGGGYRPLVPDNLNTTNDAYAWELGLDADLRWDYKNATSQTGAGIGLSDEISELALPEGYFRVQILNGASVVRTEEVLVNTFTYTQAMMIADFGIEPTTFNVEVVEILNGLTSEADSATIVRV